MLSYAVRSIVWLRTLSIIAASLAIPYFFFQEPSDWSAIFWQSTYVIVNFVNLVDLYLKRRPIRLTAEEKQFKQTVFKDLEPRQLRHIIKLGTWHKAEQGATILSHQETVSKLRLITDGTAQVSLNGQAVTNLQKDDFIGEMSFLSGNSASADVVAGTTLEYIEWQNDDLILNLSKVQNLSLFQGILSKNVVLKLNRQFLDKLL